MNFRKFHDDTIVIKSR